MPNTNLHEAILENQEGWTSTKDNEVVKHGGGSSLSLRLDTFQTLFPFHLIVDSHLVIRQVGVSLARIADFQMVGMSLGDAFCLNGAKFPAYLNPLLESNEPLILELKPKSELRLRGTLVPVQDGATEYVLFAGTPFLHETAQVERFGLRREDFAVHDSLNDYLAEKEAHRFTQTNADALAHQLQYRGAELTETNRRLQESENRYRTVMENLSQVVFQTDDTGCFTFLNPAWHAIMGYTISESLGKSFVDFVVLEDRSLHREQVRRLMEGDQNECRYVVRCHCSMTNIDSDTDASYDNIVWVGVNIRLAQDLQQQRTGTIGTLTDISARKRAEQERADALGERARALSEREHALEALRESEAYLRMVVNNAPIVLFALDNEGFFTLCEGKSLQKMGIPLEGMIGQSAFHLFQEMPEMTVLMHRALKGETLSTTYHQGNSAFELQFSPILGQAAEITGTIGIAIDITERLKMEEQLKAAAVDLQRSNQVLQEFASIASHDLQEPLRKIQAFGGRLKSSKDNHLSEEGVIYVDRMLSSANRMQNLINDLLNFSRVTTKSLPYTSVDLNEVVHQVWVDLEPAIVRTEAQIVVDSLPTIEADSLQMRQLIKNLISNALKFHQPDSPPRIKIRSEIGAEPSGRMMCCLTVTDNGIGFENRYAQRIFNVFERLHSREEYEGTGMGLAICRQIAERHRGKIFAESVPGHGSVFTIMLPIKAIQGDEK